MQFKRQCKLHIVILDYDWLKDNGKFSKPMISGKAMTKILYGNFAKSLLKCEKIASTNIFGHFLHANFFMYTLIVRLSVFLVWYENLHVSFSKLKLHLLKWLMQFQLFEKLTQMCKIIIQN